MFSGKIYASSALVFLLTSQCAVAKSKNAYGPVASGQTLWDIAAEVRPDNSVSVIQLVYSLYDLNPNAFQSSNMNLLKKGVYLKMPTKDKVLSMTNQQAASAFKKHTQALPALSASAGTLNKAKQKRSKYAKQVKRLQKELGAFRHKSNAWNKTYKQLVDSKILYKKWNNKVASIRKDLVAKTLAPSVATPVSIAKATPTPVASSTSNANVTAMEERMKALEGKVSNFASMEKRFAILEDELGQKEKIILKLRSTLRVAATAIKKQQVENKALQAKLQALDLDAVVKNTQAKLELQSVDTAVVASSKDVMSPSSANASSNGNTKLVTLAKKVTPQKIVKEEEATTPIKETKVTAVVKTAKAVKVAKRDTPEPITVKPVTTPIIAPVKATLKQNTTKPSAKKALSRDEKRRLRMAKANQASGGFTSIAFWKKLATENLIIISAVLGALVLLVISYTVIGGRRRKKLKIEALADKHNDLFVAASKLSNINTGDSNVSQIDLQRAS